MPLYTFNGTNFIVGKDAEDNWKIILEAYRDYYWVHAEGVPSAHVIIEIDDPLQEEFQYACDLCKKHTNFENKNKDKNKTVKFITTQVSNIKLGSKPGEVYFKDLSKTSII